MTKKHFLTKINYFFSIRKLAWIMLILSLVGFVGYILAFFQMKIVFLGIFVSLIGIVGSVMLLSNKIFFGTLTGMLWSALQIIIYQYNDLVLDFKQMLDLSYSYIYNSETFIAIKINFLAVLLFFLFYKKFSEFEKFRSNKALFWVGFILMYLFLYAVALIVLLKLF